jgi:uroporphyrinogen decarboxylase
MAMVCAGINAPAYRELEEYLGRERGLSVEEYLDPLLDIAEVSPSYIGPRLPEGCDIWGVRRAPVSYGAASYDEIHHHPLAEVETPADLDDHTWPTLDLFDYSVLPAQVAAVQSKRERCLMAANGNIFETAWYMRGFERMLEDFALSPELAWAIMERVTDFYVAHFAAILRAAKGEIDLVFTADDIGSQRGLLMSLAMWERMVKPHHVRLNAVVHELGAKVIYHTDGAVMEAVPGLIDMGIDVLQALQFSAAGMDPVALKGSYGDRLCFEGGVSVQTTLPFGTPEQVRQEVERLIGVLGKGGGYILGPSHAIQAGTPVENIVAAFDTAASFYPF